MDPCGTVKVAGTGSETGSLLLRCTTAPPVGAGDHRYTSRNEEAPAEIDDGLKSAVSDGTTLTAPEVVAPAYAAVTLTVVMAFTGTVSTVNATEDDPAGTVTEGGTAATAG